MDVTSNTVYRLHAEKSSELMSPWIPHDPEREVPTYCKAQSIILICIHYMCLFVCLCVCVQQNFKNGMLYCHTAVTVNSMKCFSWRVAQRT